MKYGLPDTTLQKVGAVLGRHPQVTRATLYGSRAKGNHKNGSDIDLTLHGGEDLAFPVLCKIMDELDDLLLPQTLDVSIYNDIGNPDLIGHIQRVGVTFYEKEEGVCPDSDHGPSSNDAPPTDR